ncbi:MAG: DUF262 domain-containing protein [Bacilli bacterium]
MAKNEFDIKSIKELLEIDNLDIPLFQRPYKWNTKNMRDLLKDIDSAIINYNKYGTFKYLVGTIILLKKDKKLSIVDGQQRIISFLLLSMFKNEDYNSKLLEINFKNKLSQYNIHNNYLLIEDWFKDNVSNLNMVKNALENILEVVVIIVNKEEEAFQLFDSQNTRGKALNPHDLLKAYHLREINSNDDVVLPLVKSWENEKQGNISELFSLHLYPIINWSKGKKTNNFTTKEIDTFKGISDNYNYTYAELLKSNDNSFQISESFISGICFFKMVNYYLRMIDKLNKTLNDDILFRYIIDITGPFGNKNEDYKNYSNGFIYTKNLFFNVLLCYYDRFNNLDEQVVRKLFTWAFMLRVDRETLGFDSVNKYATGNNENSYTNNIPLFNIIKNARLHTEIKEITINIIRENDTAKINKWNDLYEHLKKINGYEVKNEK